MAIERVREYFKQWGLENRIMEFDVSSATVELAAQALSCRPERIAKTLSFRLGEQCILIVAAGDAKIDNAKYKAVFGVKAKMLSADEAEACIGHAVGGVCPLCRKRRGQGLSGSVPKAVRHGIPGLRQLQQRNRADASGAGAIRFRFFRVGGCVQKPAGKRLASPFPVNLPGFVFSFHGLFAKTPAFSSAGGRAERSGFGLPLPAAPGIFVFSEILRPGSPTATGSARQKWAIPWIRFSPSLP